MAVGGGLYPVTISFDTSAIPMLPITVRGLRIQGSSGAPRIELRKMLQFAADHDIKPVIMTWPLNKKGIEEAVRTLQQGKMRYRGVLIAE